MIKSFRTIASVAAFGVLLAMSPVIAQTSTFDAAKFFEEVQARSASMPQGFDSSKFWAEIEAKSKSSGKNFDATTFFEELESRGVKMPAGFDAKKFFDDLIANGNSVMLPPMVELKQ